MTERSYYWGGTTVGDASLAPYDNDEFTDIWRKLFLHDRTAQGVIKSNLNELAVSGAGSPVTVATGAAVVDGNFYENDGNPTVAIPTPAASTRIDRIVLRKDFSAQTVRITRIAGVEGAGAPSLTQSDGVTWDIPLYQVSITTGGAITLTDERIYALTPLVRGGVDFGIQTLTDQATIAWNLARGPIAQVTLAGNRTLGSPTNMKTGATYILFVIQDGTGTRTLAHHADYLFPFGSDPIMSVGAGAVDVLTYVCRSSKMYGVANKAFA